MEKTCSQIDHVLIRRREQLSVLDVRGIDCEMDHCWVVAEFRERLLVSKLSAQTFGMKRFYLRKLNDVKVK